ncbi:MAG: glycosyltransferase family 2 protein [Lutibacter sp.]
MNRPLVSIIVPCFNQAQYMDEALQSVLDQTYINWECIVVNDGSPDNTEEVAKKWVAKDNRFKYLHQENSGVSFARNYGIKMAEGKYIQFLDSDDILEANKINSQVQIMEINPNIDIVYGSSRYFFDGDFSNLYPIHYNGIVPTIEMDKSDKNQRDVLLYRNICTVCASLYRKEILKKIRFKNVAFEDWFLNIECAFNDFIFHYSKAEDTCSFIRMTKDSQMNKHEILNKSNHVFNKELNKLLNSKKYLSILIEKKNLNKDKSEIRNKNIFKIILVGITPPFIIKIYKSIFV